MKKAKKAGEAISAVDATLSAMNSGLMIAWVLVIVLLGILTVHVVRHLVLANLIHAVMVSMATWSFNPFAVVALIVVVAIIVKTKMMLPMFKKKTAIVKLHIIGGPHDGEDTTSIDGRIACAHGFLLSSLCDTCMEHCGKHSQGPAWYSITGDSAVYAPLPYAQIPEFPGQTVSPRLARIFRLLASIYDDVSVGSIARDLSRLATTFLQQKEAGAQFEAALNKLEQYVSTAIISSTKVTTAQIIVEDVSRENRELDKNERIHVLAAVNLAKQLTRERDGKSTVNVHPDVDALLQQLNAGLEIKAPQPIKKNDHSDLSAVFAELDVMGEGLRSLTRVGANKNSPGNQH